MKPPRYRDILAALSLTRTGRIGQATLLQRTLGGADADSDRSVAASGQDTVLPALDSLETPERKRPVSRDRPTGSLRSSQAPRERSRGGRFLPLSFSNAAGTRAYKLFIPSNYHSQPCPLIVMLHGCTQTADDFAAGTRMNAVGDEFTCLVAYPQQPASANLQKCWNWFNRGDQQRDRGEPSLVAGITREIMRDYAVDPRRVYVAGMSAGAAAAAVLGTTYPDLYAAIGVHSGVVPGLAHNVPSAFAAMRNGGGAGLTGGLERAAERMSRPIPTIVFHGDRDTTVHPRNGDRFATQIATAQYAKRVETGQVPGGRAYTQTTYTQTGGQRVLEQWVIHGAGHAWSGGSKAGSYTDPAGPDASAEFVRFFLSHSRA